MGLLTLQDIFCTSYPEYERTHALPAHVRRAARAIMQCRTAALGGHVHACPDGHMSRIWYNSCRHRSCPPCAYLQTERWLALQQARLLACDHDHVIFTLPHDLNPLWLANVRLLQGQPQQAVAVLKDYAPGAGRAFRAQAYSLLGNAFENMGRTREAGDAYEKGSAAAALDFLKAQLLADAGRAWTSAADTARATAAYRRIVNEFPKETAATEAKVRLAELTKGAVAATQ